MCVCACVHARACVRAYVCMCEHVCTCMGAANKAGFGSADVQYWILHQMDQVSIFMLPFKTGLFHVVCNGSVHSAGDRD